MIAKVNNKQKSRHNVRIGKSIEQLSEEDKQKLLRCMNEIIKLARRHYEN